MTNFKTGNAGKRENLEFVDKDPVIILEMKLQRLHTFFTRCGVEAHLTNIQNPKELK